MSYSAVTALKYLRHLGLNSDRYYIVSAVRWTYMGGEAAALIARGGMAECRRYPRIELSGLISVSWRAFDGELNHVLGKCIDASERGVRFELPTRIPVGTFVEVRVYVLNLDGTAIVRHAVRRAGGYILGIELSASVDPHVLAELGASQTDVVTASERF